MVDDIRVTGNRRALRKFGEETAKSRLPAAKVLNFIGKSIS
jgi:hypothetical protein